MRCETKRNMAILDFCEGGKTTIDICERFGISRAAAHRIIGELQSLGVLVKKPAHKTTRGGIICIFTKIGTTTKFDREFNVPEKSPHNMELARVAHNPFNLVANHG